MLLKIFRTACGEIVHHKHFMAFGKQPVGQMAAYKSGSAGNNAFHGSMITKLPPRAAAR
jgi:hypothetical protein